jgi:hypothetical protein
VAFGFIPQRQVVRHTLSYGTTANPRQHLLTRQLVEVPADCRRGHAKLFRGALHLELTFGSKQLK